MKKNAIIAYSLAVAVAIFQNANAYAQTSASAFTTAYRYNIGGQLTGRIEADPDGSSGSLGFPAIRNTYDANGRLISIETGELASWQSDAVQPKDWVGYSVFQTAEFAYDSEGKKVRELTRQGATVSSLRQISYDAYDRVDCAAVRMDPAQWLGQTNACLPQLGSNTIDADRITKTTYNNRNQPVQIKKAFGTSLEQAYATYTYANPYKPSFVTDANGNKTRLCYDDFFRQSAMIMPSKTVTGSTSGVNDADAICAVNASSDYESYTYDANGNRTSLRKRDGSTITYQYDALNRNTVKVVPERAGLAATHTRDIYFGYDNRGLQTFARFDSTSGEGISSSYDGFGRLISTSQTIDAANRSLSYARDKNGNRTELTWMDGVKTAYSYDGLNRLTTLYEGSVASNINMLIYGYNNRGLRSSQTGRYSTVSTFGYDAAGRLSSIAHDNNGTANDVTYGLDAYNSANQITQSSVSNDSYVWTGGVNVNRSYAVNGLNQYTSAGPATFTYDLNGNLTGDGSNIYVYDVENRLVSASGASSASLRYDPLGRLYEIGGGAAGTTRFLYDGDELVAEYNATGTLLRRYLHGVSVDDPVIAYEGSSIGPAKWLHINHQGSIVALTDSSGTVTAKNSYDEYGIPGGANATVAQGGRFAYTGQAWLPELGMYYYKARIYSPTLGRFMQTDPIGYTDQMNLYAYVANDPVNMTDPTGTDGACIYTTGQCSSQGPSIGSVIWNAIKDDPGVVLDAVMIVADVATVPSGEAAAGIALRRGATEGAEAAAKAGRVGPGPFAKDAIPAGPGARPSAAQQRQINEMGRGNGCHTCGTKAPGTKSGNFVGDHQPPTKLNPPGGQQQYHPQCKGCSDVQGGRLRNIPTPPPPPPPSKPWWRFW